MNHLSVVIYMHFMPKRRRHVPTWRPLTRACRSAWCLLTGFALDALCCEALQLSWSRRFTIQLLQITVKYDSVYWQFGTDRMCWFRRHTCHIDGNTCYVQYAQTRANEVIWTDALQTAWIRYTTYLVLQVRFFQGKFTVPSESALMRATLCTRYTNERLAATGAQHVSKPSFLDDALVSHTPTNTLYS